MSNNHGLGWFLLAAIIAGLVAPGPARAQESGDGAHAELFSEEAYPTASQCAACHQQIYDEWSSSNHAYASISPMFHAKSAPASTT